LAACGVMHEDPTALQAHQEALSPPFTEESADPRTCATGKHQSPVNIATAVVEPAPLPAFSVHYGTTSSTEFDNGRTIEDLVSPGDFIQFGGTKFELEQFHFHHPSEHTLDGRHFPLEIHFVHQSESRARLVMAVLVEAGPDHPVFHTLFDRLPHDHEEIKLRADPAMLLPRDRQFIEYEGSLTTPPCNEGVTWIVMTRAIAASSRQIDQFARVYPHNNRFVMPLNGRHLFSSRAQ
jgi:carbonic anhydrase